jgi:Zn-dependent alcohol dehydrogenase
VRGAEIVELIDMAANNRLNLAALVTGVIDFDDINAGLKKIAQDSSLGIVIGLKK